MVVLQPILASTIDTLRGGGELGWVGEGVVSQCR